MSSPQGKTQPPKREDQPGWLPVRLGWLHRGGGTCSPDPERPAVLPQQVTRDGEYSRASSGMSDAFCREESLCVVASRR
jgi:hypothetical protein